MFHRNMLKINSKSGESNIIQPLAFKYPNRWHRDTKIRPFFSTYKKINTIISPKKMKSLHFAPWYQSIFWNKS